MRIPAFRLPWLALMAGMFLVARAPAANRPPIRQFFVQEYAGTVVTGDVRLVTVTRGQRLQCLVGDRWLQSVRTDWQPVNTPPAASKDEFILPLSETEFARIPTRPDGVRQIHATPRTGWVITHWVATDSGLWEVTRGKPHRHELPGWRVNQAASVVTNEVWAATDRGLHHRDAAGNWQRVPAMDARGRDWAAGAVFGVAANLDGRLWIATAAGLACRVNGTWRFYEPADGVPVTDFTSLAADRGDELWCATRSGVVHFDAFGFHYRQGPRWLPDDNVRQIYLDRSYGVGPWLATAGGLGELRTKIISLADKAVRYEHEIDRYIRRTPFGYVAEARLRVAGDRSSADPDDSDNDGLWTAMYGAGECFAYAATGDPKALDRARRAFTALEFLQRVTQGGTPAPPPGFVARTIRSVELPDPNAGNPERDRRERAEGDRQWKVLHPRWPKSADGKWYWKADTSSDELDGHFFFLPLYFDFCATNDTDRAPVRRMVQALGDHLLSHDFQLVDHDGAPTRWGVFSPRELNHNPAWWVERGLNSLSILTYLTVAEHITGDPRFTKALRELIDRHGYVQNLMFPKLQMGVGSGNQSDDEMAVMCFYNLIRLTRDDRLREQALLSFYQYWCLEQPERNPFFNFAYAAQGEGRWHTNAWRRFSLSPWPGWLEDSAATLQGFPLDRVNWPVRNSHRLDIVRLPAQQASDLPDGKIAARGHLRDGKVLPVENRHFGHWNTDPWRLDYGGNGHELAAGTVFLLPYYMGLYHGFIEKPAGKPTP